MAYVLFRIIRRSKPTLADFWSDFAHGDDALPGQLREPLRWAGISMFDEFDTAIAFGRRYVLGRAVVRIEIPDAAPVVVAQTGHDPHHFSVMGPPTRLLALVVGDSVSIN